MDDIPPGEYIYKDKIITIAFSDASYHYRKYNDRYVTRMEKINLIPWQGPPEKIRHRLTKYTGAWHSSWRPDGFFSCQIDGKTYHCFKPHAGPICDSNDLIVIGPTNRRVINPIILNAIAAQMGFEFGDCVRIRATLGDVAEEVVWRSTAKQFEESLKKYNLLKPGAAYEILEEFKFKF